MPETVVRSVAVPVAEVLGHYEPRSKALVPASSWKDFDAACHEAWRDVTALANTVMIELLKRDVVRGPGETRMPKHPGMYSYPWVKQRFGHMEMTTVASVCRAVEKKYREHRLAAVWRGEQSLSTYRYPMPLPIHNARWTLGRDAGGAFVVEIPVGKCRWRLRLRGGHDFARQYGQLRQVLDSDLKRGELKLTRQAVSGNTNRHANQGRENGGGCKQSFRTLVRVAAHFPVSERVAYKTMLVCTDPQAFWVWEVDGEKAKPLNADNVRRWVAEHEAYRQRMSEELKYEKRWPAEQRRRMVESLDKRCQKQRDRLHTFCHQASAMLAGFAVRQKVATVIYDDTPKGYLESFPWFTVKTMLKQKLEAQGIGMLSQEDAKDVHDGRKVCVG